jgi:DMSO/TMAO reductase YedYZ molybdopterin-dependent catalytic subunit
LEHWSLALQHGGKLLAQWSWSAFESLRQTEITTDIHCVTKWSKFATKWRGVSFDDLLQAAGLAKAPAGFIMAHCDGGYTTNVPVADLVEGKALIATHYDGQPLLAAHGGPARLLIPHLYFWKSAKWVRRIAFDEQDSPGFWESLGYHMYGDPWREQRYDGD